MAIANDDILFLVTNTHCGCFGQFRRGGGGYRTMSIVVVVVDVDGLEEERKLLGFGER